jgi:hypothetical protein
MRRQDLADGLGSVAELAAQLGVVVCAWGVILSSHDAWRWAQGSEAATATLVASFALGAGAIVTTIWPLAFIHVALWSWAATRGAGARPFVAALEGSFLAWLLCFTQTYVGVSTLRLWLSAVCVVALASAAAKLAPHLPPRWTWFARVALMLTALTLDRWLPVRQYPWLHLAVDVSAAAAFMALTGPVLARLPRGAKWLASASALALVGAAPSIGRASRSARGLLYGPSTHAQVHARVLGDWLRPSAPRSASSAAACTAAQQQALRCAGVGLDAATRFSKLASGADILLLSIDALRWDRVSALPALWAELGPHVDFRRAVSPAPRTQHALAAVLRGHPARQLALESGPSRRIARHAAPTLGSLLATHGYRAVHAPTHVYLEAESGLARGFEQLIAPHQLGRMRGQKPRYFPTSEALPQLLHAAQASPQSLVAWLHAMEAHAPYRAGRHKGPDSEGGQLRALRALDTQLTRFLRDFKRARRGRPLVLAVFADHGEEFGEHGGRYHASTVYAEQVRVPFVLAAPGLPSRSIDAPVSTAALPATLLDLIGVEPACTFTLPSLLGCIAGEQCPTLAVSELDPFSAEIRPIGYTGPRYRLLHDPAHQVLHLFDADRDPYERRDLVDSEPGALEDMLRAARAWEQRYCTGGRQAELPASP